MSQSVTTAGSSLATKILRYWLPVMFMLAAMYYFSTDVFSGENTRGVIETILGWFTPHANPRTIAKLNHIVRKMAHFTEYAVLATLLFRAFRADSPYRFRFSWAAGSFSVIACWALIDEFHQSFTRYRGSSIYDSMLDAFGGFCALTALALWSYVRDRRRQA